MFQMVSGIEDELAFSNSPDIDRQVLMDECTRTIVTMIVPKE